LEPFLIVLIILFVIDNGKHPVQPRELKNTHDFGSDVAYPDRDSRCLRLLIQQNDLPDYGRYGRGEDLDSPKIDQNASFTPQGEVTDFEKFSADGRDVRVVLYFRTSEAD
jgi:hypothetical protein